MGFYHLFCKICGGPTYSSEIITDTTLLKKYLKKKDKYYGIEPDGIWANAIEVIDYIKKHYKKLELKKMEEQDYETLKKSITILKSHKWQDKLMLLTENKNIKNIKIDFQDVIHDGIVYSSENSHIVHCDCFRILKSKYDKITYNDLTRAINKPKIFVKYQGQFFYNSLAYLDNLDLLTSPLKNDMQDKILKIKFKITRPSPTESATLFNIGTKKKDNDGNIWIIKETKNKIKKWCKIK